MKHDADVSSKLNDDAELGREARRASEAITEALYNGTRLEVYATCDGIFVGHGTEYGMAGEVYGFDLHEALAKLADALGGEEANDAQS